jgi:hypothetical protein
LSSGVCRLISFVSFRQACMKSRPDNC